MGKSSCGHRFNFDGFLTYSPATRNYVQLFRSGILEAVSIESEARLANGNRLLPSTVASPARCRKRVAIGQKGPGMRLLTALSAGDDGNFAVEWQGTH
jgi:hypothetical protein